MKKHLDWKRIGWKVFEILLISFLAIKGTGLFFEIDNFLNAYLFAIAFSIFFYFCLFMAYSPGLNKDYFYHNGEGKK